MQGAHIRSVHLAKSQSDAKSHPTSILGRPPSFEFLSQLELVGAYFPALRLALLNCHLYFRCLAADHDLGTKQWEFLC